MFQTCFGHVIDMFWTCFRHVLGMFWTCFGHVLGMFWACFGNLFYIFGTCLEHVYDMFLLDMARRSRPIWGAWGAEPSWGILHGASGAMEHLPQHQLVSCSSLSVSSWSEAMLLLHNASVIDFLVCI